jgi:lipoprotein NlpI
VYKRQATGSLEKAQEQMVLSAVNYSMDHYMGKVAQMHVQLRGWDVSQAQEKAE